MSKYISTPTRDALRHFFIKVNDDAVFRIRFLANPVEVLTAEGITLSQDAEKEVRALTAVLIQKLPELSVIPKGFDVLLKEVAKEGSTKVSKDSDPEMLIL
jgi:hypothetical protein